MAILFQLLHRLGNAYKASAILICTAGAFWLTMPEQARAKTTHPEKIKIPVTEPAAEQLDSLTPLIIRQQWQPVGKAEMRWFGFKLYHATLWTPTGAWQDNQPYALELRYARDITAQQLLQTSLDEMRRLHPATANETRQLAWLQHLQPIFPDVKAGDVIMGIALPFESTVFFHQDRLRGRINEPAFANQFFAIWLSPATREPALRRQLLGLK